MLKSHSPAEENQSVISHSCSMCNANECGEQSTSCEDQNRSKADGPGPHTVCQIIRCVSEQDDSTLIAV
jgi:hypothetical protein